MCSGHAKPDCILAIWDLKENKFIKQFKGHTDDITAISTLQDGHTIISGSKDGNIMVNDLSSKKPVKRFGSLVRSPVTCLYQMNDLSHVAIGFENGEINLCNIVYAHSSKYDRAICIDLQISKKMKVASSILCLNESHINPNTLISGHEDKKIRIWDLEKGEVRKELQTNQDPVKAMLTIENPFSPELENNFHLIGFGNTKSDVFFNQPEQNNAF